MRRGSADRLLHEVMRLVVVVAFLAYMTTIVNGVYEKQLQFQNLPFYPVATRLVYSCFPPMGTRPMPGIIDRSLFTQEQLERCLQNQAGRSLTVRAALRDAEGGSELLMNQEFFDYAEPIKRISSNLEHRSQTYYVLVQEEEQLRPASLEVEVIWQRWRR